MEWSRAMEWSHRRVFAMLIGLSVVVAACGGSDPAAGDGIRRPESDLEVVSAAVVVTDGDGFSMVACVNEGSGLECRPGTERLSSVGEIVDVFGGLGPTGDLLVTVCGALDCEDMGVREGSSALGSGHRQSVHAGVRARWQVVGGDSPVVYTIAHVSDETPGFYVDDIIVGVTDDDGASPSDLGPVSVGAVITTAGSADDYQSTGVWDDTDIVHVASGPVSGSLAGNLETFVTSIAALPVTDESANITLGNGPTDAGSDFGWDLEVASLTLIGRDALAPPGQGRPGDRLLPVVQQVTLCAGGRCSSAGQEDLDGLVGSLGGSGGPPGAVAVGFSRDEAGVSGLTFRFDGRGGGGVGDGRVTIGFAERGDMVIGSEAPGQGAVSLRGMMSNASAAIEPVAGFLRAAGSGDVQGAAGFVDANARWRVPEGEMRGRDQVTEWTQQRSRNGEPPASTGAIRVALGMETTVGFEGSGGDDGSSGEHAVLVDLSGRRIIDWMTGPPCPIFRDCENEGGLSGEQDTTTTTQGGLSGEQDTTTTTRGGLSGEEETTTTSTMSTTTSSSTSTTTTLPPKTTAPSSTTTTTTTGG